MKYHWAFSQLLLTLCTGLYFWLLCNLFNSNFYLSPFTLSNFQSPTSHSMSGVLLYHIFISLSRTFFISFFRCLRHNIFIIPHFLPSCQEVFSTFLIFFFLPSAFSVAQFHIIPPFPPFVKTFFTFFSEIFFSKFFLHYIICQ